MFPGPFADWCAPLKNWKTMYSYDPVAGLSKEEQAFVLGGEMHLWTEQTDGSNLDTMLWPRGSAAAEILWSGQKDTQGNNRTILAASPRLAEMRERMVGRGIQAAPVQPAFCTQAENSLECSF
jgi:hexosaminidase